MENRLRRTPLYEAHRQLKARIVPFAGWEMPVQYVGILEESRAVRRAAGMFDISHMGRIKVEGDEALPLLQRLTTNDVSALAPGQAHYSLLTNPQGGIIDDIIIYRVAESRFLVVINASNTEKDLSWIREHATAAMSIDDTTEETAIIAVQGPEAPERISRLAERDILSLPRFAFSYGEIAGAETTFCRTGYTGEDGFELIVPAAEAQSVWNALLEQKVVPCGLGARDALRIEAGYPLYGHEIDDTTTPVEAGLMWVVKLEKGEFTGHHQIAETRAKGPGRRLVGLVLQERIVPRQGYTLLVGDEAVGNVTSGIFSPATGRGIGMGYVADSHGKSGSTIDVQIRANRYPATVVPKKNLIAG